MTRPTKSQLSGETSDPAAESRSRDPLSPSPENEEDSEEATALARANATLTLLSAWLANLQTLFRLEFNRTLEASKRIVALQLMLLPLAIAFVLSICGGVGLIGYHFSHSPYVGFTAFLLAQASILAAILLYQRKLRALLGFNQTKRQAKEALDHVHELFK
ncbi:hypothetical protein [Microbulbifer magnicolonia]|uniref:hypothetical protein n=1 Tax=Microbulbifer magnicolonia TaxID=3109744 RepID=UPI002B408DF7|nr:hypothetical protein [Microbulbifer sp. GG15]